MEANFTAVEDAEVRLEARSAERKRASQRRARRRRILPWVLCPIVLPLLGAAAFVALLRSAGGELSTSSEAIVAVAAAFGVPAVIAALVGRWHGRAEAVLWALITVAVEVALVFGVALAALELNA